jgi:DNA-binding beta-propeller fold protein YncE
MRPEKGAPQGAPFFISAALGLLLLASCAKTGKLSVESTLRTGAGPLGAALSPDGTMLAVACGRSNDVWIHNLKSLETARVDTLPEPQDVLFDADGKKLLVSESGGDSVAQITLSEMRVTRRFKVLAQPALMTRLADGAHVLVSSLSLSGAGVFRLPGMRTEKMLGMEGSAQRLMQSRDGKELYAVTQDGAAFVRFRLADLSQQLSVLVRGNPVDLALSADGQFAWVAGEGKFFDQGEEGQEPEPGAITCVRLSDGRAVDWAPACAAIRAITLSQSGRWLFAACGEEGELQVIDVNSFEVKARLSLPGDPFEILVSPDGKRLYVTQSDLKQVSVVLTGPWQ